jgi:hypothetical protein
MSRLHVDEGGLPWLVVARNEIQTLMPDLHTAWKGFDKPEQRQWAVGVAFSLWRAAFLIYPADTERSLRGADVTGHAHGFLQRVIETNSITFGDDRAFQSWSEGYYVNNALFRIRAMDGTNLPQDIESQSLRRAWTAARDELRSVVERAGLRAQSARVHPKRASTRGPRR